MGRGNTVRAVSDVNLFEQRCPDELGDTHELIGATKAAHFPSGGDDRELSGEQRIRGTDDELEVGCDVETELGARARNDPGARDRLLPEIFRERDERGSSRRHVGEKKRAAKHVGNGRGRHHVPCPACEVFRELVEIDGFEKRVAAADVRRLATYREHDRDPILECVDHRRERVAGTGNGVQVHDRRLSPRTSVAVRHGHHRTFVQALDVLELEPVDESIEKPDLLGTAETEHVASIPFEQKLRHELAAGLVAKNAAVFLSVRGSGSSLERPGHPRCRPEATPARPNRAMKALRPILFSRNKRAVRFML